MCQQFTTTTTVRYSHPHSSGYTKYILLKVNLALSGRASEWSTAFIGLHSCNSGEIEEENMFRPTDQPTYITLFSLQSGAEKLVHQVVQRSMNKHAQTHTYKCERFCNVPTHDFNPICPYPIY